MDYETIQTTIYKLLNIRELLSFPQNWCQGNNPEGNATTLSGAFSVVGVDTAEYQHHADKQNAFAGDLGRGQVPEPVWFVRQAINKIAPEFGGLIYEWNDAPGRTHEEVTNLIQASISLAKTERQQLFSSDAKFDTSDLSLNRWGYTDGTRLCAMSALSKMLGYKTLTDMPWEVNPALSALVNLLNDRATDKSRQLLASRLTCLPYSGRTNITSLISRVFFPAVMTGYEFTDEIRRLSECIGQREFAEVYEYLGERFMEPDGSGPLATGCVTMLAAHNISDPIKQDLLAVAAASQIVGFEVGRWWLSLLQILDYIIGIEDAPLMGKAQAAGMYGEYYAPERMFPKWGLKEIKKATSTPNKRMDSGRNGIMVRWFPALVEKFSDRLDEIAQRILQEIAEIGQTEIELHRFKFSDEEIIITTTWDEFNNVPYADADLVAYQEVAGKLDLDGDGKPTTILMPIPASEAKIIH